VGFEELALLSVTAFMVGLSGALMPGTLFVAVIFHAAEKGWKVGPLIVLGHVVLEAALAIALVFGLGTIMSVQIVRTAIGLGGGVLLLWMGFGLLKTGRRAELPMGASYNGSRRISSAPVLSGLVASSVNPYFYVWWATVGNVFTMKGFELAGLVGVATFLVSHWMSDLSWYTLVSWSVGQSRRYMTNRMYRMVLGTCGLFLLALGFFFIHGAIAGTI
jgi:threonine/homoserine/homoserine lactone efflux protein